MIKPKLASLAPCKRCQLLYDILISCSLESFPGNDKTIRHIAGCKPMLISSGGRMVDMLWQFKNALKARQVGQQIANLPGVKSVRVTGRCQRCGQETGIDVTDRALLSLLLNQAVEALGVSSKWRLLAMRLAAASRDVR